LQFAELLAAIGFKPVAIVRKQRQPFRLQYGRHEIDGALDDVEGVGAFVELELQADESNLDETRRVIQSLAAELALGPSERRSYLEMLLERGGPKSELS
jgi:adenylate cyclase class 2